MKSILRLALLVALPSAAPAATRADIDVFGTMLESRIGEHGAAVALGRTSADVAAELLLTPTSPYSDVEGAPRFINDIRWPVLLSSLGTPSVTSDEALAVLRWDLGTTRSRPTVDVAVPAGHGFRDDFVAASAIKADVDADIFWQALVMSGNRYSTVGAVYAVGLQVLRRQLVDVETERQQDMGIDRGVLDRFMAATSPDDLRPTDLQYLADIVHYRMTTWRPGGRASNGERMLPMPYRIARVAAAYRDTQGYVNGGTCLADARPRPDTAGMLTDEDDRPLCFVAATDRAVHYWYLREHRAQMSGELPNQHTHDGPRKLAEAVFGVLAVMDLAAFVETTEALVADRLAAREVIDDDEAEIAGERVYRLTCGREAS